jgi:hypothetical protein
MCNRPFSRKSASHKICSDCGGWKCKSKYKTAQAERLALQVLKKLGIINIEELIKCL